MPNIVIPDAFEVTIYLDLPDEAAWRADCLGWENEGGRPFRNEEEAAKFAKYAASLRGWDVGEKNWSATIDRGHVIERRIEGAPIREFEDELRDRWYVGPTWFDYEPRAEGVPVAVEITPRGQRMIERQFAEQEADPR